MGRYIDWYLVELEGLLEGRLRPDRAHDLVSQAEAHLVETSDRLRAEGMAEKASELAAIQKFGSARKIADEAGHHGSVPHFVAKLLMLGSFAAFTGLASLSLLRLGPSDWFVQTYLWGCGVVFFIAAMFVKRVPWRELIVLGLTSGIVLSLWSGQVYPAVSEVPRGTMAHNAQGLLSMSKGITGELQNLHARRAEFNAIPAFLKSDALSSTRVGYDIVQPWPQDQGLPPRLLTNLFTYPKGITYKQPEGTSTVYAAAIRFETSRSGKLVKKAWQNESLFVAQLAQGQRILASDAARMQAHASGSVWQSAVSHSPRSLLIASIWLAGAMLLGFAASILPQLTLERSRVYRELA
ncbi:MAG: HAAS signaling domain-containing protein [Fimbriimonadales bacterium]